MFKSLNVREMSIAAGLAALSTVVQLVHIGYQSPQWGMWIDVVAVTWIVAFLLFGFRVSLVVSLVGALMITLFAPDTWLGAGMKWIASVPTIMVFALWIAVFKKHLSYFDNPLHLLLPVSIAMALRCLIVLPVNYYYAIPIWTGMSPEKAIAAIPWYIIVIFNMVQGILEVSLAWMLVYKFRLDRYGSQKKRNSL